MLFAKTLSVRNSVSWYEPACKFAMRRGANALSSVDTLATLVDHGKYDGSYVLPFLQSVQPRASDHLRSNV